MANVEYDPAKIPCDPLFVSEGDRYSIDGPGGSSILTENNEKGILETNLFEHMRNGTRADLSSSHDGFRQGIYVTNDTMGTD